MEVSNFSCIEKVESSLKSVSGRSATDLHMLVCCVCVERDQRSCSLLKIPARVMILCAAGTHTVAVTGAQQCA